MNCKLLRIPYSTFGCPPGRLKSLARGQVTYYPLAARRLTRSFARSSSKANHHPRIFSVPFLFGRFQLKPCSPRKLTTLVMQVQLYEARSFAAFIPLRTKILICKRFNLRVLHFREHRLAVAS